MKAIGIGFFATMVIAGCDQRIIDYNSALSSCTPDTIKMIREKDTLYSISQGIDCIIGAQLPTFNAITMAGDSINNEYFHDKVTVINFWFIGCKPCEAEIPGLNKLVEKYASRPVQFLAIGRNSPENISEYILTNPFAFDHIAYGEPIIVEKFHSRWGYPFTIVTDQNMKIIYATHGGAADSTAVEKIQSELIPVIETIL